MSGYKSHGLGPRPSLKFREQLKGGFPSSVTAAFSGGVNVATPQQIFAEAMSDFSEESGLKDAGAFR